MIRMMCLSAAMACLAASVCAQELMFSELHTEACMQEAVGLGEKHNCIGASANQCMRDTPGGHDTVGMTECLDREAIYWDTALNTAYQRLLDQQTDGNPSLNNNLRDMQRAWITYRDTRCEFEFVHWGGGTGGGPAILSCLMQTTAEQVFVLEQKLR